MKDNIAIILEEVPLCRRIVQFLLENQAAMDTVAGIAAWWVHSDKLAVETAAERLLRCGVMTAYARTSGMLYGLTQDQEVRAWLQATYGNASSSGRREASIHRPRQPVMETETVRGFGSSTARALIGDQP